MRITVAFLAAFVATSSALTCYKSDKTMETCSNDDQECAMGENVFTLTSDQSKSYWTTRGCTDNCTAGDTTTTSKDATVTTTTTCCNTDDCNSAGIAGSILCYACSSTEGYGCKKGSIDTNDMKVGLTTCKGSCNKVYESKSGWVARGCPQKCTEGTPGTWEINCCTTDKCNHGMHLIMNSFLILVAFMAFTFYNF